MHINTLVIPMFALWLVALVLAGTLGRFGVPGWMLLGTLAVIPLIVIRQIGRGHAPTMSQTIDAARR
jgi:hypothetical protein